MGELASNRATFRSKFELEKRHHSHSDIRSKVVKSQPKMESSSPSMEMEEIIKHMKHLPNYLENGKPIHDRALSFGVMDWNRLQKWQHQNQNHKHEFVKTNKYSSSSSNSSLFSNDESSPSQSQSWSPSSQKVNRVTLQSHFTASPNQDSTPQIIQKTPETKNSNSFKIPDIKTRNTSRSISPLRRFSFSSKSTGPTERPESPVSNRSHSSPLRRLLDPIFSPKSHEDSRTKAKVKLDFRNEVRVDEVSSSSSSSRKQALFQTTVKNDRLLFTFAVENNDILAATLTSLTSTGKTDNGNSIYTFFTVHEVKRKNVGWLSHGTKNKDHGYVPNVTAQMKVTKTREFEFVLFSVNPSIQPQEELEAIVVKFSRNQERFNTTVVLPGGTHGAPIKGEPSSLTDRWRSGGACDCGGWDEGCKLKTLTNRNTGGQFELFVQGEGGDKRPMFSLSPLKEGIFSVEYNSSLSDLQAFSICISVLECRKTSQNMELRTRGHEGVPVIYTPVPGIKKNVTGKDTSL
ncbi:hypothetical protein L1887_12413 [Cichorium endivia]|nr:hypothetical protein L1887_12413 [Cichorium endivia]